MRLRVYRSQCPRRSPCRSSAAARGSILFSLSPSSSLYPSLSVCLFISSLSPSSSLYPTLNVPLFLSSSLYYRSQCPRRSPCRSSAAARGSCRSLWTAHRPCHFGFGVSCFGFRVSCFVFRVSYFVFRDSGFVFRVSCFVFRVSGFRFRVWGFGTRVYPQLLGQADESVRYMENSTRFWVYVTPPSFDTSICCRTLLGT